MSKEMSSQRILASSIRGCIRSEIKQRDGKAHFAIILSSETKRTYSEVNKIDETREFLGCDEVDGLSIIARNYLRRLFLDLGHRIEKGEDEELKTDIMVRQRLSNMSAVNETVFFANVQDESENESAGFERGTLKTAIINKYRVIDSLSSLLTTEYSAFTKAPEMYRLVHDRSFPNPVIDSYCTFFRKKASELALQNEVRLARGDKPLDFGTIEDDALYVLQHSAYNENYLSEIQNSDLRELCEQTCFVKPKLRGNVVILVGCTSFQNAWSDSELIPLRDVTEFSGNKRSCPRVLVSKDSTISVKDGHLITSRPLIFCTAVGYTTIIVESVPYRKQRNVYEYEKKSVTQFINSRNKRYLRPLSIQCSRAQAIRSQLRLSTLQRMFLAGRGLFIPKYMLRRQYDEKLVNPDSLLGADSLKIEAEANPDLVEISPLFKQLMTVWSERVVHLFADIYGYDLFNHIRNVQSDKVFYGYGLSISKMEVDNKLASSAIPLLGPLDQLFSISLGFKLNTNQDDETLLMFGRLKEERIAENFLADSLVQIKHVTHRMLSDDLKAIALSIIKISILTDKSLVDAICRLGSRAEEVLNRLIINLFGSIFAYAFTLNSGDTFRKGDTVYKATMSEANYDIEPLEYYDVDPDQFKEVKAQLKSHCELKECSTDLSVGNICLRSSKDGTDFYSIVRVEIPISKYNGWQATYRSTVPGSVTETTTEFGTNKIDSKLISATIIDAPTNTVFLDKDMRILSDKPFLTEKEVLDMVSNRLSIPGLQCYQTGNPEFEYWITDIGGGNPQKLTALSASLDVSQDVDDYSGRLLTSKTLNIDYPRTVRIHGNVVSGYFENQNGERITFGSKRTGCCWCYAGSQDRSVTLPVGTYRMEILAQEGCVTGHRFEVSFSPALSDSASYDIEEGSISLLYTPLLTTGDKLTQLDESHAVLFLDTLYTVNEGYTGSDSLCFSKSGDKVFLNKCNAESEDVDQKIGKFSRTLEKENCILKTSAGEISMELQFPMDVTDFVENRMQDCVKFNLVCDSASTGVISTCDSQNAQSYDNVFPVDTTGNVPSAIHSDSVFECKFNLRDLTKDCPTEYGLGIFCWILISLCILTIVLIPVWIKIGKSMRLKRRKLTNVRKTSSPKEIPPQTLPTIKEDDEGDVDASDTLMEVSKL